MTNAMTLGELKARLAALDVSDDAPVLVTCEVTRGDVLHPIEAASLTVAGHETVVQLVSDERTDVWRFRLDDDDDE